MTEAELDEMERRGGGTSWDCIDVAAVFAWVRRLREALKRYGKHEILDCALYSAARRGPDAVCTCGLDAALVGG